MNHQQSMHGGGFCRWVLLLGAAGGLLSGCAAGTLSVPADNDAQRLLGTGATPSSASAATGGSTSRLGSFGTGWSTGGVPRARLAGYAEPVPEDEKLADEAVEASPTEKRLYMDCFLDGIELPGQEKSLASFFRDAPLRLSAGGHLEQSFTWNVTSPSSTGPFGRSNGLRLFDDRSHDYRFNQLFGFIQRDMDPDTTDLDVSAKVVGLFGMDARFTHALGLLSAETGQYQIDLLEANATVRIPPLFEGMNPVYVTAGKFVTPVGAEVIDATGNLLFSHSFIFNYGIPFTHLGGFIKYPWVMDEGRQVFATSIGILQGWDTVRKDNNAATAMVIVNWDPNSEWSLSGVLLYGAETLGATAQTGYTNPGGRPTNSSDKRILGDFVLKYMPTERWNFMLEGTFVYEAGGRVLVGGAPSGEIAWGGLAFYSTYYWGPRKNVKEVGTTLRLELFNDEWGVRTGFGGTYFSATFGVAWAPAFDCGAKHFYAPIIIRPEVRWDYFAGGGAGPLDGGEPFPNGSGNGRHQVTLGGDLILKF